MQTLYYPTPSNPLTNPPSCVTIGNFDGIHKGHQSLLLQTVAFAQQNSMASVAITFNPHPLQTLKPDTPLQLLNNLETKLTVFEQIGIDKALVVPFTHELATWPAEKFVEEILVKQLNIKHLFIGHDFSLGKAKQGTFAVLKNLGKQWGFTISQLNPLTVNNQVVSSTIIRQNILDGAVKTANEFLGQAFSLSGKVVKGHQRGSGIGFPTANMATDTNIQALVPLEGVYAGWVTIHDEEQPILARCPLHPVTQYACPPAQAYGSAISIGTNPTFKEQQTCIEAHLLDYKQDIYGKFITIYFVERIRAQKKFDGLESLIQGITQDVSSIKELLATVKTSCNTL